MSLGLESTVTWPLATPSFKSLSSLLFVLSGAMVGAFLHVLYFYQTREARCRFQIFYFSFTLSFKEIKKNKNLFRKGHKLCCSRHLQRGTYDLEVMCFRSVDLIHLWNKAVTRRDKDFSHSHQELVYFLGHKPADQNSSPSFSFHFLVLKCASVVL